MAGTIACFIALKLNICKKIPAYYLERDLDELNLMKGTWDLSSARIWVDCIGCILLELSLKHSLPVLLQLLLCWPVYCIQSASHNEMSQCFSVDLGYAPLISCSRTGHLHMCNPEVERSKYLTGHLSIIKWGSWLIIFL